MNVMQAYHDLTRIAAQTHGGCAAEYNNAVTWKCAVDAVRMQADIESLMREHQRHARLRVAIAAARMVYAMRSATVR